MALRSTDSVPAVGTSPWTRMPRDPASAVTANRSAVATSVLLGTQSVSTAEPPGPSVSTMVTRAPSCAATSAAS